MIWFILDNVQCFNSLTIENVFACQVYAKINIGKEFKLLVTPFSGEKCPRCWKMFESSVFSNDDICKDCKEAIK